MCIVVAVFALVSRVCQAAVALGMKRAEARYRPRLWCIAIVSLGFVIYLHGICAMYILMLIYVNWRLSRTRFCGEQTWRRCVHWDACFLKSGAAVPESIGSSVLENERVLFVSLCMCRRDVLIWAFNIGSLILIRVTDGFLMSKMIGQSLYWLDTYRGVFRWEISYNLTMLRLISYSLDCSWRRHHSEDLKDDSIERMELSGEEQRKIRKNSPLPLEEHYGLLPCIAQALYLPLYIAGPIITYNDFMWQVCDVGVKKGSRPYTSNPARKKLVQYFLRLILDMLCIELVTHFFYFNSIAVHKIGAKYKEQGLEYHALQVAITGWWVLSFMWLKFTVIWRFFRLAALLEGIDPPENMRRCFAMNYDIQGFWKNWHASFNQWLVRYMYIPFGGAKYQILTIWPIFFFVALWHDIDWRLLGWAWVMCLAFLPEILVKHEARSNRWDFLKKSSLYDVVCGVFATINITALMAANMAGFVVGLDGLMPLLHELLSSPVLVLTSLVSFYCAARLMFLYNSLQ